MLDVNDYQKRSTDAIRALAWRCGLDMRLTRLRGPRADYELAPRDGGDSLATLYLVMGKGRVDAVLTPVGAARGEGMVCRNVVADDQVAFGAVMETLSRHFGELTSPPLEVVAADPFCL